MKRHFTYTFLLLILNLSCFSMEEQHKKLKITQTNDQEHLYEDSIKSDEDRVKSFMANRDTVLQAYEIVKEKNLDPNIQAFPDTVSLPIVLFVTMHYHEAISLIMDARFNPNIRHRGSPVIFSALGRKLNNLIPLLINHSNFNPNLQARNQMTAFMYALKLKDYQTADLLVSHPDFAVNFQDKDGYTPAMMAIMDDSLEANKLAEKIINHPLFSPNIQDFKDLDTVAMNAIISNKVKIAKMILKHPLFNPNIKNNYGNTAFALAIDAWDDDIQEIILDNSFFNPSFEIYINIATRYRLDFPIIKKLLLHPLTDISLLDEENFNGIFYLCLYDDYLNKTLILLNQVKNVHQALMHPCSQYGNITALHILALNKTITSKLKNLSYFKNVNKLPLLNIDKFREFLTKRRYEDKRTFDEWLDFSFNYKQVKNINWEEVKLKYGENINFAEYLEIFDLGHLIDSFDGKTLLTENTCNLIAQSPAHLGTHVKFIKNLDEIRNKKNSCFSCLEDNDTFYFVNPCGNHDENDHEYKLCVSCHEQYLHHVLNNSQTQGAVCPVPGCMHPLKPGFFLVRNNFCLHQLTDCNLIELDLPINISKNCMLVQYQSNPNNHRCITENCPNYFYIKPDESKWVSCKICYRDEFHLRGNNVGNTPTLEDKEFEKYLKDNPNIKTCPKCKAPTEKNLGCSHMTCKNPGCKYEYHWATLKPYKLNCPNPKCGKMNYYNRHAQTDQNNEAGYYSSANVGLTACQHCGHNFEWE